MTVELVNKQARFRKLVASPHFERATAFGEELVAVCMNRATVNLNNPIYVVFSVLELSKLLIYQFHYGFIVPIYGDRAKLLFTSCDSLCYYIACYDVYKDMAVYCNLFDFSDYPSVHPLFSVTNKKVIGKMKDETNSSTVSEFCGLRAKMYSILCSKNIAFIAIYNFVVAKSGQRVFLKFLKG